MTITDPQLVLAVAKTKVSLLLHGIEDNNRFDRLDMNEIHRRLISIQSTLEHGPSESDISGDFPYAGVPS